MKLDKVDFKDIMTGLSLYEDEDLSGLAKKDIVCIEASNKGFSNPVDAINAGMFRVWYKGNVKDHEDQFKNYVKNNAGKTCFMVEVNIPNYWR